MVSFHSHLLFVFPQENISVKDDKINTTQSEDELKQCFLPGNAFGFNVELELVDKETETASTDEAVDEESETASTEGETEWISYSKAVVL